MEVKGKKGEKSAGANVEGYLIGVLLQNRVGKKTTVAT
jgi:hypothetical protein